MKSTHELVSFWIDCPEGQIVKHSVPSIDLKNPESHISQIDVMLVQLIQPYTEQFYFNCSYLRLKSLVELEMFEFYRVWLKFVKFY